MELTSLLRRTTVGGLTALSALTGGKPQEALAQPGATTPSAATSAQEEPAALRLTAQQIEERGGASTIDPNNAHTTLELLTRMRQDRTAGIRFSDIPDGDGKYLVIPLQTVMSIQRSARDFAAPLEAGLEEQRSTRQSDGLPARAPIDLDRAVMHIRHNEGPSQGFIDATGTPRVNITTGDLLLSQRHGDLQFIVAHALAKTQVLPELGRAPLDGASRDMLRSDLIQADTRTVQALCAANPAVQQDILLLGTQLLGSSQHFPAARVEALEDAVEISCPPAVSAGQRADSIPGRP